MTSVMERVSRYLHIDPYGNLFQDRPGERLKKAFSAQYVASKLALIAYEKKHPYHPWITKDAISRLTAFLRPDHRGFEWGSGKGTIWFAQRSESLVSVEHNAQWHEKVSGLLLQHGLA